MGAPGDVPVPALISRVCPLSPGRAGEHNVWTGFHFWKAHPPEIPTVKEAGGKWRLISEEIKATGFVLSDFFISLRAESYPASSEFICDTQVQFKAIATQSQND